MIMKICIGVLCGIGLFMILADHFRIPYMRTSKAVNNLAKQQKENTSSLDVWLSSFASFIAKKLKLNEIQNLIKENLSRDTAGFGITIVGVGINNLGVPKTVTDKVFDRMIAERKQFADKNLAEGKREAKEIRINAERERTITLAKAEAEAQKIRAEGDAAAAEFYQVFREQPELAEFLRKLDALRVVMKGKTTVVFDTAVPPFDLLTPGAAKLPATTK